MLAGLAVGSSPPAVRGRCVSCLGGQQGNEIRYPASPVRNPQEGHRTALGSRALPQYAHTSSGCERRGVALRRRSFETPSTASTRPAVSKSSSQPP
jgi:hypothetical protein